MHICVDNRERKAWDFSIYGDDLYPSTLKAGDYSLLGFEDQFAIERKATTSEISINLGIKRKQFENKLSILSGYREAYILCEFPESYLDCFPSNSGIPRKYWRKLRVNAGYLRKSLFEVSDKYNVPVLFFPSRSSAEEYAHHLMVKFCEKANQRAKTIN